MPHDIVGDKLSQEIAELKEEIHNKSLELLFAASALAPDRKKVAEIEELHKELSVLYLNWYRNQMFPPRLES